MIWNSCDNNDKHNYTNILFKMKKKKKNSQLIGRQSHQSFGLKGL